MAGIAAFVNGGAYTINSVNSVRDCYNSRNSEIYPRDPPFISA